MKTSILLISACLLLYSCSQDENEKKDQVHHFKKSERASFTIEMGEQLFFSMRENRTTDVRHFWLNEQDCQQVKFVSDAYLQDPNPKGYPGVGGRVVYTFEGSSPGVDTLIFGLRLDHYMPGAQIDPGKQEDITIVVTVLESK